MNPMKAYIFDLDGTLFESMDVWQKVDVAFFKKRNINRPDDYVKAVLVMDFDTAATYTKATFNLPETPTQIKQEWLTLAADAYANDVQLKPYAKEYLLHLKSQGHKLAVATSLPEELMQPTLHKHEIYHIFDAICTATEVGCGKNKPDVFLLAAKKLNVSPKDCLLYDDILAAVVSAKSIGMKVCGVYDKHSRHNWEEIKQQADQTIHCFSEIYTP